MNRFIQPPSEEFLYGSPEIMGRVCYRICGKIDCCDKETLTNETE